MDYVIDSNALPAVTADGDTVQTRRTFDASNGCERLVQAVVTCAPGRALPQVVPEGHQEILYVVSGRGTLEVDGETHALEPDIGVFLAAGETCELENPGPEPLVLVGVRAPEDREAASGERRVPSASPTSPSCVPTTTARTASWSTRTPAAST